MVAERPVLLELFVAFRSFDFVLPALSLVVEPVGLRSKLVLDPFLPGFGELELMLDLVRPPPDGRLSFFVVLRLRDSGDDGVPGMAGAALRALLATHGLAWAALYQM